MLYNTWRPRKFSDVVGQTTVVENLVAQSIADRWFGVYIFCGQFGSGKTSTARILAMAANCEHKDENGNPCGQCEHCKSIIDGTAADVVEIAAAVNTGVDKVRELCEAVEYRPVTMRKKVYIIDEVQALSKAAFQAFLKMLEEPPAHAMFILATTDVGAIPPTVRSRAAVYYFSQLSQSDISDHLCRVSTAEMFSVTKDACDVIAKHSQGSMRNALSLLEMATQENGTATGESVEKLLGVSTPDAVFSVIKAVLSGEASAVVRTATDIIRGGADLQVLVNDMLGYVADLTVAAVSLESIKGTEHYLSLIRSTVPHGSAARFSAFAEALFELRNMLRKQTEESVLVVALVKIARNSNVASPMIGGALEEENRILRSMVGQLEARLATIEGVISEQVALNVLPAAETVPKEPEAVFSVTSETSEEIPTEDASPVTEAVEMVAETEAEVCENESAMESLVDEPTEFVTESVEEKVAEPQEVIAPMAEESSGDDTDEDEDDFFSFLGEMSGAKKEVQCKEFQDILKQAPDFKAAMACCSVNETEKEVVITTEFPAVKKFVDCCLRAYGLQNVKIA